MTFVGITSLGLRAVFNGHAFEGLGLRGFFILHNGQEFLELKQSIPRGDYKGHVFTTSALPKPNPILRSRVSEPPESIEPRTLDPELRSLYGKW